jgi:hypothetical protein
VLEYWKIRTHNLWLIAHKIRNTEEEELGKEWMIVSNRTCHLPYSNFHRLVKLPFQYSNILLFKYLKQISFQYSNTPLLHHSRIRMTK